MISVRMVVIIFFAIKSEIISLFIAKLLICYNLYGIIKIYL